jgi:Cerato-platanin
MDVSRNGVVLSQHAMDQLTGGNAVFDGAVDATVQQVDVSNCF